MYIASYTVVIILYSDLRSHRSSSVQGLDLRVEHTHCFSEHGEGGHYHCDTTPAEAAYHGYYTVAEQLVRIDQPKHTHDFGRD